MKKNIIITGSTSGIGKELVRIFAKDGSYHVFAGYRNKDLIERIDNVEYFYIDMKISDSIKEAANFIKSNTDKIDILINVAGCVVAGPIEKIPTDKLREQFEVNTFSHIEFTQNLVEVLENGRIINISSMASFGHFPFISPYCASKRALDIFFNAFALENYKNIKVISVKPGVIATPIWKKSVETNEKLLNDCADYEKEMCFMKKNALSNTDKGLDVLKAAKMIKLISEKKNPKASYTLGKDAAFARILSLFSQDVINKLVSIGLKSRIK
ncbi:SDR family NAD(P)-dependent oxidoreductase [bacterium]|nr:SDR family NAD(P)-dependent oxidoreductase [bacterium]